MDGIVDNYVLKQCYFYLLLQITEQHQGMN